MDLNPIKFNKPTIHTGWPALAGQLRRRASRAPLMAVGCWFMAVINIYILYIYYKERVRAGEVPCPLEPSILPEISHPTILPGIYCRWAVLRNDAQRCLAAFVGAL